MGTTTREVVFDAQRIREIKKETTARILSDKSRVSAQVWPILDHIADHLFDGNFDATALRAAPMSDGRKPKRAALDEMAAQLGQTPAPYIKEQRMKTAKKLLETTGLEVQDIAEIVCGVRVRAFSTDFKAWDRESRTPEAYRAAGGRAIYSPKDWLQAWLWFWIGIMTDEQFDMMLAMEKAQIDFQKGDDEFVEEWARGIESFWEKEGLEATLPLCRQHECCTGDIFEVLSRLSREAGRNNRQRGSELAEIALAVIQGSAGQLGPRKVNYLALGWARLGNARRLASDLDGAEMALQRAEFWAETADDAAQAEVFLVKGSLRLFQRRFSEALEAYNDSIAQSQAARENLVLIDALFSRASLYLYQGLPGEALPDLEQAQLLLPPDDLRRKLVLVFSRLDAAILAQDWEQIRELLPEAHRLSKEVGDRPSSLQLQWIEGLLLREMGHFRPAETALKQAREGFSSINDLGMLAICSLELALLYHAQGRRPIEVIDFAVEALPALEALRVPEASGALSHLGKAIGEGQISRPILELARRRLLHPAKWRDQEPI